MKIHLSAATTADGALDDRSAGRLRISTDADWAAVQRLRAQCDAILVGAGTVRRDNPRLVIADTLLRTERSKEGRGPDPAKVTVTRTGCLDPASRFFTCGEGRKIVFSETALPHLEGAAETVVAERITAARIATELEKRGIGSLLVEGGAEILRMFLAEGMAHTLRLAVNPALRVADAAAPHFPFDAIRTGTPCRTERLGGMEVRRYTFRPDRSEEDLRLLREAVELSRRCTPCRSSYCVGAVIATRDGRRFGSYTHETSPTHHAEQEAAAKALAAGADLRGATIYSSMEPCSTRSSEPESCSELILRHGMARVVFALYEPDCFVSCRGALDLREHGVEVEVYPELGDEVRAINGHLKG